MGRREHRNLALLCVRLSLPPFKFVFPCPPEKGIGGCGFVIHGVPMVFLDAPRQAVYLYFPYQLFPLKRAISRLNMHAVFSFFPFFR